jgi:hypothetical protein
VTTSSTNRKPRMKGSGTPVRPMLLSTSEIFGFRTCRQIWRKTQPEPPPPTA